MSREDGGQVRVVVRKTCPLKLTEPGSVSNSETRPSLNLALFGAVAGPIAGIRKKHGSKSGKSLMLVCVL